jgi:hypothetical protein
VSIASADSRKLNPNLIALVTGMSAPTLSTRHARQKSYQSSRSPPSPHQITNTVKHTHQSTSTPRTPTPTHYSPQIPQHIMAEYAEADPATNEQQGDSKKISFRFCREW